MKKLTIGITTYNSYPFINELIYNIESQYNYNREVFEELEFILVDDNSSQKEMNNVINNLPSYIKIIRNDKTNGTPATSRNKVIDNSNGEYVLFIDGDDNFIATFSEILEEIKKKSSDILVSNVVKIGSDGKRLASPFLFSKNLFSNTKELINDDIKKMIIHQTGIWSVYKVSFLKENDLYYDTDVRYEDNFFMTKIYLSSPTISLMKTTYYGWRNNFSSFSHKDIKEVFDNRIRIYERILMLLSDNSDNFFVPWLFYSIWNQTYINIIRNYPRADGYERNEYKKFFLQLQKVSSKYQENIKLYLNELDDKYIDKYTLFVKYTKINKYFVLDFVRIVASVLKKRSYYKMKLMNVFLLFPINKKKIFFTSHYGDYNDNSKYKYLELKKDPKYAQYRFIFAVKDEKLYKNNPDFINYNNKVVLFFHHYTSKTIYFNSWYNPLIKKRKHQLWYQLWHGIPYKKVHTDINTYNVTFDFESKNSRQKSIANYDYIMSVNDYNTKIFQQIFGNVKIIEEEYPKTKWLLDNTNNKAKIVSLRNKYNIEQDESYILYAPTYRPYTVFLDLKEVYTISQEVDKKLIIHLHPLMNYIFLNADLLESNAIRMLDNIEDIQEVILIMDAVITDYSSIKYDFERMNKDIYFYKPDLELYKLIHGLYENEDE